MIAKYDIINWWLLVLLLVLVGCSKSHHIIPDKEIKLLKISARLTQVDQASVVISDQKIIQEIIGLINSASREPEKFKSEYEIEITYSDATKRNVLINRESFKIDGLTYRAGEDIGAKLAALIEKGKRGSNQ